VPDPILDTLRTEFGDFGNLAELTRVVFRLFVAMALAACIGWEREQSGAVAGLRTHMLVSLGVALMVIAASQSKIGPADLSRVLQGIFAGVGFVGAAAIIRPHEGQIHGVTTAAGIWATAAIAAAAGLGRAPIAMIATAFAVVILVWLRRVEHKRAERIQQAENEKPG